MSLGIGCATSRTRTNDAATARDTGTSVGDAGSGDGGGHDAGIVVMPDAFVAMIDGGHDAGRDAGNDAGHDAGSDAGHDAAIVVMPDAGMVTGPIIDFPTASDTSHTLLMYYWNMGDYVEGTRTTTVASITHLQLGVVVSPDALTCDTQDMEVLVNGTMIGSFSISGGATMLSNAYTFPAIAGPTYTFRFQTTRTVAPGCGSAGFDTTSSHITIAP